MKRPAATTLLMAATSLLAGCRSSVKGSEADALRAELETARRAIASLTAQRDEALAKIAEADRVRLSTGDLAADAAAALPRVASISIDRLSGLTDSNPDDTRPFDAIEVYLRPLDGRGRFVQIVGTITLRADLVPADSAAPSAIASITLAPAEVRDAYRSTFLSTHYTLRLPLPPEQEFPPGAGLAFTAEFLDALTGQVHRDQRMLPIAAPILSR